MGLPIGPPKAMVSPGSHKGSSLPLAPISWDSLGPMHGPTFSLTFGLKVMPVHTTDMVLLSHDQSHLASSLIMASASIELKG